MDITHQQALKAIKQAAAKSEEINIPVNITVLDTAGHLKGFLRMEDALLGTIDISMSKAKTAALFRMNTEAVGELMDPKLKLYGLDNTNGGIVGMKGGMALTTSGKTIGYIGVSGGTVDQDFEIATAGSEI